MQFNSIAFIFCFLPLFLAVYFIFPSGVRSTVLLAGSLLYYSFASSVDYHAVMMLILCTCGTYAAGFTLNGSYKKVLLTAYLSILAILLGFLKVYSGGAYLPAGMSFYLFQLAAYLIEVYRKKVAPQRDIVVFGSRIIMFPKLLSGPLMAPAALHEEGYGKINFGCVHDGIQLFILGLGLKVILANRVGGLWTQCSITGYAHISAPAAWLALTAYAMQLYCDFWGYSLMAAGLGRMLGFELPRNFDNPYASKTVSEFYRRWHMTLGLWFREYVYIPLGGNRNGVLKTIANFAVVWALTGLWHGAGGNYLLWAGILFLLIANEKLWLGKWLKRSHVMCHVYLVFTVLLSWVPFAIGDWTEMRLFFGRLFGVGTSAINPNDYLRWGSEYVGLLIVGVILATPLPEKLWMKLRDSLLADILLVVLFWVSVYFISTAQQDPFLYFQF